MFPAVAVKKADSLLLSGSGRLTSPHRGVALQLTTAAGRGRDVDQVWEVRTRSTGRPRRASSAAKRVSRRHFRRAAQGSAGRRRSAGWFLTPVQESLDGAVELRQRAGLCQVAVHSCRVAGCGVAFESVGRDCDHRNSGRPSAASSWRILRVASKPSKTGVSQSIRTSAKESDASAASASSPWVASTT